MSVKIFNSDSFYQLTGAQVYHNGEWTSLYATEKVYLNSQWQFLGDVSSGSIISSQQISISKNQAYLDTILEQQGKLYISSGGFVENVTLSGLGAQLNISEYGKAHKISNYIGNVYVHSLGSIDEISINDNGMLTVYKGGTATSVTKTSQGTLVIHLSPETYTQGTYFGVPFQWRNQISGLTVSTGTELHIEDGAAATNISVIGSGQQAWLYIYTGGSANGLLTSNGVVYINGGAVSNVVVDFAGTLIVYNGGMLTRAHASRYGGIIVSSQGTVNEVLITNGATITVRDGGLANSIIAEQDCSVFIQSQGSANNINIASQGTLAVTGGVINNISVASAGKLFIQDNSANCIISNVNLAGGALFEWNANSFNVGINSHIQGIYDGQSFLIEKNTLLSHTITSGQKWKVNGAYLSDITVKGSLSCTYGRLYNAVISSGGSLVLSGSANNITISSGGHLSAGNYGSINYVIIEPQGQLYISGSYNSTIADPHTAQVSSVSLLGKASLVNGGLYFVQVESGGCIYVYTSGGLYTTQINEGGIVSFNSGSGGEITINQNGSLVLNGTGHLVDLTINKNATVVINAGWWARDINVNSGGSLIVSSGGRLSSTYWSLTYNRINNGGTLIVKSGGIASNVRSELYANVSVQDGGSIFYA